MQQWVIMKQIAVEAETPEEAVAKISEGKTISFSISQRPQPQQTGRVITNQPQGQTVQIPAGATITTTQ